MMLSDFAFLIGPLVVGLGVPALATPQKYVQCGRRPSLQPPGYVFGVAWTLLYALYGAAACSAWRGGGRRVTPALAAAAVTLAALVAWSVVFFNACMPSAAFAAILALLGLASAVAALYGVEGRTTAAALSVPLVAWLAFASYLSFASIPGR